MHLESQYINLGDQRRNRRFIQMVNTFVKNPGCSVPHSMKRWYDVKATYGFWQSKHVSTPAMIDVLSKSTLQRAKECSVVLSVQDTTNVNFASDAEDLGYLDHGKGLGLMCHNNLCISAQGNPIGLIDVYTWARPHEQMGIKKTRAKRPIEDKESYRWIASKQKAESLLCDHVPQLVTIADREADLYELFCDPRPANSHLLIRAAHNRKTDTGYRLKELLNAEQVSHTKSLKIQRKTGKKYRIANFSIKHGSYTLKPPAKKDTLADIKLQAILVQELRPEEGKKPIEWMLLSTLPIENNTDLQTYVQWYAYRWLIERYHYVLKSGCGVEDLQLQSAKQLEKALITFSLVAFKLLWLTYESRLNPHSPSDMILEEEEWKVLCMSEHRKIKDSNPPKLKEAVRLIAMMGGFIGRKSDGDPGVKTLWQGMNRLQERVTMFKLMTNKE